MQDRSRRCECNLTPVLLTCNNGANAGRKFWKCPANTRSAQCKFFEWADDEAQIQPPPNATGNEQNARNDNVCYKVCVGAASETYVLSTF